MKRSTSDRQGSGRPRRGVFRPLFVPFALLAALACSESSSLWPSGEPASVRIVEGAGLRAPGGTVLPEGPTIEVLDARGRPVPDVPVGFTVLEGGGQSVLGEVATDVLGKARGLWILGTEAGVPQRLRAWVGGLTAELTTEAFDPVPGETYIGRNGYVEYYAGTLPVVLSAPHGGDLDPTEMPDRNYGTFVRDRNTIDLILRIRAALHELTGEYPHVVLSRLDRLKLDPNREIVEAAQGDPEAERAWWEYHTFLDRASGLVEEARGEGLYIDLHGHGHEVQRLELGYLLSGSDLSSSDEALAGLSDYTSIRALAVKPGVDLAALLRGSRSLGSLMEAEGFPAVPSEAQPSPGADPYFSGGYSTVIHGSRDVGRVSGVQIECNYSGVRDSPANRQSFAEALARSVAAFFATYFDQGLFAVRSVSPPESLPRSLSQSLSQSLSRSDLGGGLP